MKTRLGLFWFALAMIAWVPTASGQYDQGMAGGAMGPQGNFQPVAGDFQIGMPGRVWFETNLADRGLGYQGSYLTLGGKTRLFSDALDGRWLGESQLHYSLENGRFFGNLGISRVFSVHSAGADFTMGAWADYDDDQQGDFAHSFSQLGINGSIKTRRWDVIGNGYFPVGTSDHSYGLENCFVDNRIVIIPGIDTALKGFDVTLRLRPRSMSMLNGTLDLGGYGYQSALVDPFGGGRARLGFQLLEGMIINTEVNYDDRFDLTGVLQLAFLFGANARGNEHTALARDLEPTIRNDHIVRFQQDIVYAIDPDTGRPYNVWHVDNNADPAFGDGRAQTPFDRLLNAQNASGTDDIIFVHRGDGTVRNYNTGIVLKDGQLLLGDGSQHLIPLEGGRFFDLCNDLSIPRPVITGRNNGPAVTLANRNTVRSFIIDGASSSGGMSYAIYGNGFAVGSPINSGIIEDNIISGAILDGVYVNDLSGDWNFARNDIQRNGRDGILLENACDPTSVFNFEENVVNSNGRDGIHMVNYDAESITFLRNITSNNNRDGIRLENFKNGSGNGLTLDILGHTSDSNLGSGVSVIGGTGNIRVLNSSFTNNGANGLNIVDWVDGTPGSRTLIGTTSGTTDFTGNSVGINIQQNVGTQTIVMEDLSITDNIVGIRVDANNLGTVVNTNMSNNTISDNLGDGVQLSSTAGASHFVNMNGDTVDSNAGVGIRFLVGDSSGTSSAMTSVLENVTVTGSGGDGISNQVFEDGLVDFSITNSIVDGNGGNGMSFNVNNDDQGFINRIRVDSTTASGNGGNGFLASTAEGTLTDVSLINSTFSNNTGNGVSVTALGLDTVSPPVDPIDNRTRLTMVGSTANGNTLNGISLVSQGDARLLADVRANTADGNALNGVDMQSSDSSVLTTRFADNQFTNNTGRGLRMETFDRSTINSIMTNNSIINNDPTGDAEFVNGLTGDICLAMSNNAFGFVLPVFVNNGAPGDFRIELDGATNGFQNGDIGPGFTFGAFGSVCEGIVAAEEAAFAGAGF
ncbi:MAG: right-handed parallel beta-helix repeat-containing protein [Pirellulaceae bacterium]